MALTRLGPNQSINLATNTTGTLGVANGGIGITSGTTDQFLKFTGSTTLASAADNAGLVFINEASSTTNVGSVILDNVFTSTYQNYLLIGFMNPADNNVEARFLFRTGGSSGSDLTGSEYAYSFVLGKSDVSTYNSTQATGAASCGFAPDVNNDSTRVGVRLALTVFDPFSTKRTTVSGTGKYTQSDANFGSILGGCDYKGSTSITGMKFYFNSGNLTAHFRAYGIVNS